MTDQKRFLSPDELRQKEIGWEKKRKQWESDSGRGIKYAAVRTEGYKTDSFNIELLHRNSIIAYICRLLQERGIDTNEPIQILDVGGGAGFFAEQLRQEFGDAVRVRTTGLDKNAAQKLRTAIINQHDILSNAQYQKIVVTMPQGRISDTLHPDDLVHRSIMEFDTSPEFDVIVDTCGEGLYTADEESLHMGPESKLEKRRYLEVVFQKLKLGGLATIVPSPLDEDEIIELKPFFLKTYGVYLVYDGLVPGEIDSSSSVLKIVKTEHVSV